MKLSASHLPSRQETGGPSQDEFGNLDCLLRILLPSPLEAAAAIDAVVIVITAMIMTPICAEIHISYRVASCPLPHRNTWFQ